MFDVYIRDHGLPYHFVEDGVTLCGRTVTPDWSAIMHEVDPSDRKFRDPGYLKDFYCLTCLRVLTKNDQAPSLVDQVEGDPTIPEEDKARLYPGTYDLILAERRNLDLDPDHGIYPEEEVWDQKGWDPTFDDLLAEDNLPGLPNELEDDDNG